MVIVAVFAEMAMNSELEYSEGLPCPFPGRALCLTITLYSITGIVQNTPQNNY